METAKEMRKLAESYYQSEQNKRKEKARAFLNKEIMPIIKKSAENGKFETPWLSLPTAEQADWKEVGDFLSQLGYNWGICKGKMLISWGLY